MKENFFLRLLFKAYLPGETFHHLHQTTDHLFLKIFSSENYLNKVSKHLFIDQDLASQVLSFRLEKLVENLKHQEYDNNKHLRAIQNALVFANRKGLEKVPYFLKWFVIIYSSKIISLLWSLFSGLVAEI